MSIGRPYNEKRYKEISIAGNSRRLHIVMAEKALGRKMPSKAVVHHLAGGKFGPIVICPNTAYHALLHLRQRAFDATGDCNQRKCMYCKTWDSIDNLNKPANRNKNWYHKKCHCEHERSRRRVKP